MNAVLQPRMTLQAYLDGENAQVEKHELVQGEICPMTGGRRADIFACVDPPATA